METTHRYLPNHLAAWSALMEHLVLPVLFPQLVPMRSQSPSAVVAASKDSVLLPPMFQNIFLESRFLHTPVRSAFPVRSHFPAECLGLAVSYFPAVNFYSVQLHFPAANFYSAVNSYSVPSHFPVVNFYSAANFYSVQLHFPAANFYSVPSHFPVVNFYSVRSHFPDLILDLAPHLMAYLCHYPFYKYPLHRS